MKHVLVTGGAGYIGSHACKLLAQQGYIPVIFDSLVTGWASAVKYTARLSREICSIVTQGRRFVSIFIHGSAAGPEPRALRRTE